MHVTITQTAAVRGELTVPADKAIGHRAALLCAVASGPTAIRPWPPGEDGQHTLAVLRQLGVGIRVVNDGVQIDGVGLTGLRAPQGDLDCGDSGTTMRLAAGLLAGQPFASRLTAAESLGRRPMRRIIEPLSRMGARCEGAPDARGELCPPLVIEGRRPLKGLRHEMTIVSAQVKSAILLAGLYADEPTILTEPTPTRDHTERLLNHLGVSLTRAGRALTLLPPRGELAPPRQLVIPGDPSSAAFFVTAASMLSGSELTIRDVGLNPTRVKFLEVLRRMGASIHAQLDEETWEPRGSLTVASRPLRAVELSADEAPAVIDELPILMVAACAAQGISRFRGLRELRVKETDRLESMMRGLSRLGARVATLGEDGVEIAPGHLRGAAVEGAGDHRTAMSLAMAGLLAEGRTVVRGAECVQKSFGGFFDALALLIGPAHVQQG